MNLERSHVLNFAVRCQAIFTSCLRAAFPQTVNPTLRTPPVLFSREHSEMNDRLLPCECTVRVTQLGATTKQIRHLLRNSTRKNMTLSVRGMNSNIRCLVEMFASSWDDEALACTFLGTKDPSFPKQVWMCPFSILPRCFDELMTFLCVLKANLPRHNCELLEI